MADLHGWAETIVKDRGADYSSIHGETCPVCKRILREGQRVFMVTEREDDVWVHEEHVADA